MREIVLDTETTGLDPRQGHRIIEIGALEIVNKVQTGKKFHFYVNPERDVPYEAFRIHNISSEFLLDKPKFIEIAEEFLEFIEASKLIIHNAAFDLSFLNFELSLVNLPSIGADRAIDTLHIARRMFPGARNSLDALCKRFNIDNSHRQHHGALLDASLLADVYVELTGGRQEKLDISSEKNNLSDNTLLTKNFAAFDLVTIPPSNEELIAHQKLIKKIAGNI